MLFTEIFRVALEAIRANKLRSFLTALGIIIGISAVIAMVALGEGAQRTVQARLQSLGVNTLIVRPGQEFFGGVDRGDTKLTAQDAEALLRNPRAILDVTPEMQRRLQVEFGSGNGNISVTGAWPSYFSIQNFQLASGRLFNQNEERGRRRVAVLGATVGEDTLNVATMSILGQTIRIQGIPFEVIGVLQPKGSSGFQNPDDGIYIPLSTAQFRVFGTDRVQSIDVQAVSDKQMDAALAEIDRVLRREHRRRATQASDFTIRNQTTLVQTFQETTRTFSFLLAGIALVSLLVGGIGIMNIMLVSVTERTREIGVRKALGARRRDILLQFLIEALALCLAGGAMGVLLGVGGAVALQRLAGWNTAVSIDAVGIAFFFSAAVGVFFGLWPARRAARLDPIEALRYE
ncbi:MAG TPA: ABC transporter permease [Thermoanaerobaculia bacterium]|jgi:putative ABC transport system permease protein|nr:ABC transporter permease [Thermoanaerobaculia bacterium]